jgi:hypothetical protein
MHDDRVISGAGLGTHRHKNVEIVLNELVSRISRKGAIMKTPSVLGWYRILRAHHAWTVFQAVRYAVWLAR